MQTGSVALLNWYFFKGHHGQYPFHFDDPGWWSSSFKPCESISGDLPSLLITTALTSRWDEMKLWACHL